MFHWKERRRCWGRFVVSLLALVALQTNVWAFSDIWETYKTSDSLTLKWDPYVNKRYYVEYFLVTYQFDSDSASSRKTELSAITLKKQGWQKCQVSVHAYGLPKDIYGNVIYGERYRIARTEVYTFYAPTPRLAAPTWKDASVSGSKISLSWSAVANAESYTILYKKGSDAWKTWKTVTTTSETYAGTRGTTYSFCLYANPETSAYECSNTSATKTVTIPNSTPTPTKLSVPTWKSASVSGSKISLSWSAVANAGSYKIEYKKGSDAWKTWKTVTTTSETYAGTRGTTYSFRLYAVPKTNAYKQSDASATKTVTIPNPTPTKLSAPTWKSASVSGSKISLSWSAVANAESYIVEYKKGSDAWKTWKTVTTTSATYAGTRGTTYSFRLYAKPKTSAYAQSDASATKTATIPKLETPLKLATPTWKSASVSGSKISLSWSAVANAGSYKIEYKKGSDAWKTWKTVTTTSETYAGTRGTTYSFRLYAVPKTSAYKESDASATKTVTIPELNPTKLSAPTWKSASVSGSKISLSWSAVANAGSYKIEYKKGSDAWKTWKTVTTTSETYAGTRGTTYSFRLYAVPKTSAYKESDASATKTVTIPNPTPTKLSAPTWKNVSVSGTKILLSWNAVANAESYAIQYRKDSGSWNGVNITIGGTSFSFSGDAGATYTFRLYANPETSAYERSDASATRTVKMPDAEKLSAPMWKNVSVSGTKILLSWNAVANAASYTIAYKKDSGSWETGNTVTTTSCEYIGTHGATYSFCLCANPKTNSYAQSDASATKTVTIPDAEKLFAPTWKNVSVSGSKISLSWSAVANAGSYKIEYKKGSDAWETWKTVTTTSETYAGTRGTTYSFRIYAVPKTSAYKESDASATKMVTIPEPDPEKTPIATPVLSGKVSGTTITVSWSAVDKARGYKIFWKEKGASGGYQSSDEINGNSYQITGVAGKTYEIYAVAYPLLNLTTKYQQSKNSKILELALSSKGLETPRNIKVTYNGNGKIIVTWDRVAEADVYWYDFRTGGYGWNSYTTNGAENRAEFFCNVPYWEYQTFEFRVSAKRWPRDWKGETIVWGPNGFEAESEYSESIKYVYTGVKNPKVKLAPLTISSVYTGKSGMISYAFAFDWSRNKGLKYVDKIVVAYQYRINGTSKWSEIRYIADDRHSSNVYITDIVGLTNNKNYDFRFALCATETMRNQGFETSDWVQWNNVRVHQSNYYNIQPTFVDYNIRNDSYRINW